MLLLYLSDLPYMLLCVKPLGLWLQGAGCQVWGHISTPNSPISARCIVLNIKIHSYQAPELHFNLWLLWLAAVLPPLLKSVNFLKNCDKSLVTSNLLDTWRSHTEHHHCRCNEPNVEGIKHLDWFDNQTSSHSVSQVYVLLELQIWTDWILPVLTKADDMCLVRQEFCMLNCLVKSVQK